MSVVIVTGSAGLVGSDAARHFAALGYDVVGIDNDLRKWFFGDNASTARLARRLTDELGSAYEHHDIDVRDQGAVNAVFRRYGRATTVVIHAAGQPSHDWSATDPVTDFAVNASGTLNMLEATRQHAPAAAFVFTSTNKVYGDTPNRLPFVELPTRWEIEPGHPFASGIDETMSIDRSTHSPFGVSKAAADLLVQEYGRYFDMPTVAFRAGCISGPNHAGAKLHGFLAYLMRCVVVGARYEVYGYRGKQVRDNLHSADLATAIAAFASAPRCGEVYNMGGGRSSNCSLLEAISLSEELAGRGLERCYRDSPRVGDHQWYVSDTSKFERDYPGWRPTYDVPRTLKEIYEVNADRWARET